MRMHTFCRGVAGSDHHHKKWTLNTILHTRVWSFTPSVAILCPMTVWCLLGGLCRVIFLCQLFVQFFSLLFLSLFSTYPTLLHLLSTSLGLVTVGQTEHWSMHDKDKTLKKPLNIVMVNIVMVPPLNIVMVSPLNIVMVSLKFVVQSCGTNSGFI